MATISTILITRNEEANLERCLLSCQWSNEIVVVDSGSTDRTREIALAYHARFFSEDWKGYTAQKNSAASKSACDWILSLDADEELPPETQKKIQSILRLGDAAADGYFFRRKVFYLGRWITHGDWYPDHVLRLWRRGRGEFVGGQVHESVRVAGRTEQLREDILHYTYKDLGDQKMRMHKYARLWAQDRFREGRRAFFWDLLVRPPWRFVRGFLLRLGFLDGWRGFLIAWFGAAETALKYWLLLRKCEVGSRSRPTRSAP